MGDDKNRERTEDSPEYFRRLVLHGWFIVCGIAVLFVLYGIFAFFVIGDKGPPDWDFGSIKDIPGESVYSTYPYRDQTGPPEPQHVDQEPPQAAIGLSDQIPPASQKEKPRQGERQKGAEPWQGSKRQGQRQSQQSAK